MFRAVIFDWDGTLADTKRVIVEASKRVLADVGCMVNDEFIERRIGIGSAVILRDALDEKGVKYDRELLEELVRKKNELQRDLSEHVKLFEGAVELLEQLYGRIKIALATMCSRKVIEKLLLEKGIGKYFEVLVTADEVSRPKPNPEIFKTSQRKLGVNPEGCLVIEDSVFGVKAAKAAGMQCIAIPSGPFTEEELRRENPDLLVDTIAEKDRILHFLFRDCGS